MILFIIIAKKSIDLILGKIYDIIAPHGLLLDVYFA